MPVRGIPKVYPEVKPPGKRYQENLVSRSLFHSDRSRAVEFLLKESKGSSGIWNYSGFHGLN